MKQFSSKYLDLILRSFLDELTPQEREELNQWLRQSSENKKIYEQYKEAFLVDKEIFNIDVEQEWRHFREKEAFSDKSTTKVISFTPSVILRYAAAAVIIIFFALFFYLRPSGIYLAKQSNKVVILPDNSVVKLRKGAKLVLSNRFGKSNRKIKLYGQAYFIVMHNPDKPFTVQADGFSVQVLGTEFYISDKDKQVLVNKGIVKVQVDDHEKKLRAGEQAVILNHHIEKKSVKDKNILAWATDEFVFNNTNLERVFEMLAYNYGVRFIIQNPNIREYKLTATFKNLSLEQILTIIEQTEDVVITKKEDNVYIVK